MGVGDLDLMSALKTRMQWHQARQKVIAENVANADSPRYKAKDLKPPVLPGASGTSNSAVRLAVTQSGHLSGAGRSGFKENGKADFEVTPSGNAVDLETEMTRSAENQLDYQTAASLYQQSMSLIRTALGRK
jgi:flagellar basal-body rod protein FlgB